MTSIGTLRDRSLAFAGRLKQTKKELAEQNIPWYPYGSLDNFGHMEALLGYDFDLKSLTGAGKILDIGAADGEMTFFLESEGFELAVIDHPPTNHNGCRALHALKAHLQSKVEILEMDIDAQFQLPGERFGLAIFLGILYHLKNPYFALERLAQSCNYALISTRIARYSAAVNDSKRVFIGDIPVAYLVGPNECNNDATNFWMYSPAGLKQNLDRAGWDIVKFMTVGNTKNSDPATAAGDERAFCLVKSRYF
jgi:tRNA (mo5U34)-methyltransferase